jgi:hypothetical protein
MDYKNDIPSPILKLYYWESPPKERPLLASRSTRSSGTELGAICAPTDRSIAFLYDMRLCYCQSESCTFAAVDFMHTYI